jgi:hypothetical protein
LRSLTTAGQGSTFQTFTTVEVMELRGGSATTQDSNDALLQDLVRGERARALRAQLTARHQRRSAEEIEEAVQAACELFLRQEETISDPGQLYAWILRATGEAEPGRSYDESRYVAPERLDGMDVLLIDDTWTAGGHAQSAAHALRAAGADHVGAIVIGRHVNPAWEVAGKTSGELLATLPKAFDWSTCAVHGAPADTGGTPAD